MPRSRVTIRDVAAHAGVSHQTVSRVINNNEHVLPATRAQVEASIQELGYQPNAIARSMARGRTCTLACISPNLTDYTLASIIEGAESEVRKHEYFLVSSSAPDEAEFSRLMDVLITSRRAEGLLVINPYADGRHHLIPEDIPVVFVAASPREDDVVTSVALDDENTAYQATQHLLDLGHQRVGMLTGPMVEDCSQDRSTGYHKALAEFDISVDPALIMAGDWTATSGYQALERFLQLSDPPTAIFSQNDRMAIGILRKARELNIQVPDELSVIGVDDMPLSSYFDPPLSTMRQDPIAIGRKAAQLLIDQAERRDKSQKHVLMDTQLIHRKSSGPYRKR